MADNRPENVWKSANTMPTPGQTLHGAEDVPTPLPMELVENWPVKSCQLFYQTICQALFFCCTLLGRDVRPQGPV